MKKYKDKKKNKENEHTKKELISSINNVIVEMETTYYNYNDAPKELVDYYLYDLKAKEAKYNYLRKELAKFE